MFRDMDLSLFYCSHVPLLTVQYEALVFFYHAYNIIAHYITIILIITPTPKFSIFQC